MLSVLVAPPLVTSMPIPLIPVPLPVPLILQDMLLVVTLLTAMFFVSVIPITVSLPPIEMSHIANAPLLTPIIWPFLLHAMPLLIVPVPIRLLPLVVLPWLCWVLSLVALPWLHWPLPWHLITPEVPLLLWTP